MGVVEVMAFTIINESPFKIKSWIPISLHNSIACRAVIASTVVGSKTALNDSAKGSTHLIMDFQMDDYVRHN